MSSFIIVYYSSFIVSENNSLRLCLTLWDWIRLNSSAMEPMQTPGDTHHGPASQATTRPRNVCSEILRNSVHTAGCYAAASSANESSQQIKRVLGRIYNNHILQVNVSWCHLRFNIWIYKINKFNSFWSPLNMCSLNSFPIRYPKSQTSKSTLYFLDMVSTISFGPTEPKTLDRFLLIMYSLTLL